MKIKEIFKKENGMKEVLLNKIIDKILADDSVTSTENTNKIDSYFLNKKVIIRTYSAGVHFGTLIEKSKDEVILKDSRRLWYWQTTNKGISLNEVANTGLHNDSKVCASIGLLWLQAIEILICTNDAIESIEGKNEYTA